MKVHIRKTIDNTIPANNMKIGQIGILKEGSDKGMPLLRSYDQIVCLSDPSETWDNNCKLRVELLPPGTIVILTTEI